MGGDGYKFPYDLSEDFYSGDSLLAYWRNATYEPIIWLTGFHLDSSVEYMEEFDENNSTEIAHIDIFYSNNYGQCYSFVLKRPRLENDQLFVMIAKNYW